MEGVGHSVSQRLHDVGDKFKQRMEKLEDAVTHNIDSKFGLCLQLAVFSTGPLHNYVFPDLRFVTYSDVSYCLVVMFALQQ